MNLQQRKAINPFIVRVVEGRDVVTIDVHDRLLSVRKFSGRQLLAVLKLDRVQDTVRKAAARRLRLIGIRACRKCGCTEDHACEGGCWWVSIDVCSSCDKLKS